MKRRVLSFIITLALCLNLCPVWALAADAGTDGGLCPHHPEHTDECGYVSPVLEQECTHNHDSGCYTTETECIHEHTAECYPTTDDNTEADAPDLCTHTCTEDSGCVTRVLSCTHEHDDSCGYVPENPGAPCEFVCRICPIEDLISKLPDSVSADNSEQVQAQLDEIYALYDELTEDEQQQVDLSPCVSLLDGIDGMDAEVLGYDALDSDGKYILTEDTSRDTPYVVDKVLTMDTKEFTLTATQSNAIQVTSTGELQLMGKVTSTKGAGVEVQSGGSLSITGQGTVIRGLTYALDVAADATVQLSTGTYVSTGGKAAIQAVDGDFAELLAEGYAFFDKDRNPILPADMATATAVMVGECTEHSKGSYTHNEGAATHTWTCEYCAAEESEACTFTFDENGIGTCDKNCGNTLTIDVDESKLGDLVYDGTDKTADVTLTVKLNNATELTKDTDYEVSHTTRADVGEITVTVTGKTFNGTFIKTYHVAQDKPGIKWDATAKELEYDGRRTTIEDELPSITITIKAPNIEDLHPYIQYSYRKAGDTEFTDGLPLDAGEYEIKAYLLESQNYTAAETNPLLSLTIKAIDPVKAAPSATTPTYNRSAQALVTAGTVDERAVGAKILFTTSQTGPYDETIPTGTDAGSYDVWYKVEGSGNYNAVGPTKIDGVEILRKPITPAITVQESSYVYDGSRKAPTVTVKDDTFVLDEGQYTVTWAGTKNQADSDILRVVDTYTATITGKEAANGGNYEFTATAVVEIVPADQVAINITGQPAEVYYGDTVSTLGTTGGTGNGAVAWSIAAGGAKSNINAATGVLTVKDVGSITVKAERTVPNYGTASDTWTFTVKPKPVVAEVTIAPKVYDGNASVANSAITATVKDGDLVDPADSFTLSGLTGAYDDANVGTGKTVTLDDTNATKADDSGKYTVSYPDTVKGDITPKNIAVTVELSGEGLKEDGGTYFYVYDGSAKTPDVTVKDAGGNIIPAGEYAVAYSNNINVGTATVTVTAKDGGNYTFTPEPVTETFGIKEEQARVITAPEAAGEPLTFSNRDQKLVTKGEAYGGTMVYSVDGENGTYEEIIPGKTDAGDYTVHYKVQGDANHSDSDVGSVTVTIAPKTVNNPTIELFDGDAALVSYTYDGNAKEPRVVVKDGSTVIDEGEYNVVYSDNTNAGKGTASITDKLNGNYTVTGSATFVIEKAPPTVTAPRGKTGLRYNGELQELVSAGASGDGTMYYSVNGGNYSTDIPTASAVGTYTIDWKVLGDANHSDTVPARLDAVKIEKNTVTNPRIALSSDTFTYNGNQQQPVITVYDGNNRIIPQHEYTVTITGAKGNNMVDVDTYTITIASAANSNYDFQGNCTKTFEIVQADQETISITGTKAQVLYGDIIQLGTTGGAGGSTVTWKIEGNTDTTLTQGGLLTVKDVNTAVKVTATCSAGNNYKEVSATWEFTAAKKPVTAVVTVASKDFDDSTNVADADITATVKPSDLAFSGDSITIDGLTASYEDKNVGTNKTVKVNSTGATAAGTNADKYDITYPATTTATIRPVAASVDTAPEAVLSLTYDASQSQELVTAGTASGGTMVYSLDDTNYTPAIPKAKDAGDYTVYYKVRGDQNHTDSAVGTKPVTIDKQAVAKADLQIELSPPSAQYDGVVKRPTVTVRDTANNVIPAGEYTVVYDTGTNWKDVGSHTVKVKNVAGGNYIVADKDATFEISTTAQNPLEIVNKPGLVYYGDTFTLSATGGSGGEKVEWSSSDKTIAHVDANGLVTIKGTGSATITAKKAGGTNYEAAEATYPLNALKKPVTAIVSADDRVYVKDNKTAAIHISWKQGDLVGTDSIDTTGITGTFADDSVGTNKTVTITGDPVSDATSQKYDITIPRSTTASILKADATAPTLTANNLVYDGTAQALVSGGNAGTTLYSDSRSGVYTGTVPTGTNAGTYTVWYKEQGDDNHNESEPQAVTVTISPKTLTADTTNTTLSGNDLKTETADGTTTYYYLYDGSDRTPIVTIMDGAAIVPAGEYTVSYSNNKNVSTDTVKATVTVTDNTDGNYTVSGSVTFEIRKGGAQLTSPPRPRTLTYTGAEQELVDMGSAEGGHIEYAVKEGEAELKYSAAIPKKTDAGTYTVFYKVVGDDNHEDDPTVGSVTVTISPKTVVSPVVTVSGNYTYDGSAQAPADGAVEVKDGTTTIPAIEYALSYSDNVNAGTAKVIVTNANGGNYIVNGTGTFEITKAAAPMPTAPEGFTGLPYNGAEQELAKAGSVSGGTLVYSLDQDGEYTQAVPTGKDKGSYTVWYKVLGDENHEDGTAVSVSASIVVNNVTAPTIQLTPDQATYNGEKQEPAVTVKDDKGLVIDGSEYTAAYAADGGSAVTELINVGTYTLTITGKADGNYIFDATDGKNTAKFKILAADQTPLTIEGKRDKVCYGDTIQLSTTGGDGEVTWDVGGSLIATIDSSSGLLKITGSGASVTVTATSKAAGYDDKTAAWVFYADKKPVTAVVTAAAKTYDGVTPATTTVTATLQSSDLVGSDKVEITLTGTFEDPNAGTDKRVTVDSTNPTFSADSTGQGNYNITYPAATTASILKADVTGVNAPAAVTGLEYTGNSQPLVTAGTVTGGTMEYSLNNIVYYTSLPTGTDAGGYDVWYRVRGDGNHKDVEGKKLDNKVTIAQQNVSADALIIEFDPSGASYDGNVHRPVVTVKDKNNRVIPDSEYGLSYGDTDWTKATADTVHHMVTVTNKTGGNYVIDEKKQEFTITHAGQSPLSIINQPGSVRYGDSFTLSTTGGSGTAAVVWSISGGGVAQIDQNGLVKVLKSGSATVTARKPSDGGYAETTATWSFSAEKKVVRPVVTAKDKEYDGKDDAVLEITWKDGDLLGDDTIDLDSVLTGRFSDASVGTGKKVTITGTAPESDKYDIKIPASTTASITPKAASVAGVTAKPSLEYTGVEQALVSGGTATGGDLVYSLDGISYGPNIPTGKNAGKYTVWYKVQASENYKDSAAAVIPVTISPKTVNSPVIELSGDGLKQDAGGYYYEYDGTAKKPDVVVKDGSTLIPAGEYTVSYSSNTAVGTATVTVSNADVGNYTVSGLVNFTIKAGVPAMVSEPQPRELTYTGRAQALVTAGTAVNGRVMYCMDDPDGEYKRTVPTAKDADIYTVWYKAVSDDGTNETDPNFVEVEILPKSVTPTVLMEGQYSYSTPYTGRAQTPVVTVKVNSQELSDYSVSYSKNTNVGTAEVIVESTGGNYEFFKVVTFEITKSKATFLQEPQVKINLFYTGKEQKLVTGGTSANGQVLYSTDGFTFSPLIPTGIEKGSYPVYAKVQGGSTYEESDLWIGSVEIGTNTVNNPIVTLSQSSFNYTGSALTPTVTVTDDSGNVIPAGEYTVSYSNNTNVGEATVTVTGKGDNYSFTAAANFQIVGAGQTPLTITGKQDTVYYGDTLSLGTSGGSGSGAVTWSATGPVDVLGAGQYKVNKSGSVTITATKAAGGGYGEATDTWTFYANPKPVSAIVTAADKPYDGNDTATLTVTVSGGLVAGDSISSVTAQGHFTDGNVGTNKTIIITGLTIPAEVSAKYDISCPATTTASITPKYAEVISAPEKAGSLTYNGSAQALLTNGGTADGGNLMYSLDGRDYSYIIPTGTDAKTYTVWYMVEADDENRKDSMPVKLGDVTISANTDTPSVLCTPSTFQHDGTAKTPDVVVRDSAQRVIPESEYTVTLPADRTAVGKYTVTVTDKSGSGNYEFTAPVEGTFEIVSASQSPLSIITDKPTDVYYGDSFRLSAMGGSGSGAIEWSIAENNGVAEINANGVVTVKGTGGFTVKAYRKGADGYSDSNTDSVPFVAKPKPVTPVVTAADKPYDGSKTATLTASWPSGALVGTDTITLTVEGQFDTADAGNGKRVNITDHTAAGANADKYAITWPESTTASIYKVDAKLENRPAAIAQSYDGSEKTLISAGNTVDGIGKIVYSLSQSGTYSEDIPTAVNAGKYTVWYKVADSVNYTGIPAASVEAEIAKATPTISTNPTASSGTAGQKLKDVSFSNGGAASVEGKFAWTNGDEVLAVSKTQYDVTFTPNDTANYETVTFQIAVTVNSTREYESDDTNEVPMQTTVRDGTASTVVSHAAGSELVREAAASQSPSIVIKPEITGEVTRAEVSIPASTLGQIERETNAALTVSAPMADVTISRAALDTLSSAGGTVGVATEQVEQGVEVTLTAGGEKVESVPGGVTLTVPAENAGPGTVAVLVHEDGTRETVRKSVAGDGKVSIPLNGSATVEIVDNSREFTDVPPENWAADAAAFASAHELFSGTGETTFSPDQPMSRGMLATVLYRLEGCPAQDKTSEFSDVSGDAWYADGVAWATENGIADGYGDGQFAPDESITREQFAVMLWKYAGSPEAKDKTLAFTDADQASSYAQDALCWAVENGILSGYGDGQLVPRGTATRAEAAQMLKKFMENI